MDDLRVAAVHDLFQPVDSARAVFRGLVLVGHQRSIQAGHMFWALPGRGFADGVTLRQADPMFRVINQLYTADLVALQPRLQELTQ